MGMRKASHKITICEILRKINDLHQGHSLIDTQTRKFLSVAEDMAKRMDKKLRTYNEKYDKEWWKKNLDYKEDLIRREKERYCVG